MHCYLCPSGQSLSLSVSVGDVEVLLSRTVRNKGAMMDSALTMQPHVHSVIKSCYVQMRNLSKTRKYLTEAAVKSLTHTFVSSHLVNMNSVLYDLPNELLKKLKTNSKSGSQNFLKHKINTVI